MERKHGIEASEDVVKKKMKTGNNVHSNQIGTLLYIFNYKVIINYCYYDF